ncbi:hypothetical protein ACJIZ3_023793 [Penstemon smallii]|uniref:Uncharacterized protein n=1 Tax=Penstemon smallii TaxID=265156 RepID=A0ABD3TR16_9LAMI
MAEMEMLEVAVTFSLETIRDLVVEEAKFLRAVDGEVKKLQEELERIQWFLKDVVAPNVDKEKIKAWVLQFQDIAYDNGSRRQRRSGLAKSIKRCICLNEARESHQVGLQIQELSTRISNLKKDFETYGVKDIIQSGGASSSLRTRQQLRRSYSHVGNFILILDDIWDSTAWESIKNAIHKDAKVLLTTRNEQVAKYIGPNGFHHQLRFLKEEECWALLQKKSLLNTGEVSKGRLSVNHPSFKCFSLFGWNFINTIIKRSHVMAYQIFGISRPLL